MDNIDLFFTTARERHLIYIKRSTGRPAPWTDDPIFRRYKFCNVYRQLDRTTQWLTHEILESDRYGRGEITGSIIMPIAAFRWFNRIETGRAMYGDPLDHWIETGRTDQLRNAIAIAAPNGPYVTGAYIIKTPDGMPKLDGVCWALTEFHRSSRRLGTQMVTPGQAGASMLYGPPHRLEDVHRYLLDFPYLGAFMAYELVSDLRHTPLLHNAPDINTWANPGPGAKRGLGRVFADNHLRSASRGTMLEEMQNLLRLSRSADYWPQNSVDWPTWEMREVEHWLCEFDKYMRVSTGAGHPRSVFDEEAASRRPL